MLSEEEPFERDPDLPRPRLSMPIDDDDDDSFQLAPPRLSEPLGEDNTQRSIEVPRRAISEQPANRIGRESFGVLRLSDRFADINELDSDAVSDPGDDDDAGPDFDEQDYGIDYSASAAMDLFEGDTLDLRRAFLEEASRRNHQSEVSPALVANDDDDEPTFAFDIPVPARNATSSPIPDMDGDISDAQLPRAEIDNKALGQRGNKTRLPKKGKEQKVSRFGIPYPSLPVGVVKKLASTFARSGGNGKSKIDKDTVAAIMQATDWFLEQAADDLGTYAKHSGRKTIDESDVTTLMKRQRQLNANTTPFSLAQRYLPRELIQDIRMAPPPKPHARKAQRLDPVEEEPEGE